MTLSDAITAAGMTPPKEFTPGRWLRFPGIGKSRSNRSGWCRVITPQLAIFGDWSSNFTSTWRDADFRDDETTQRLLEEARKREREFLRQQQMRQRSAANKADELIRSARWDFHSYLARKGFGDEKVLVHEGQLVVPMRDLQSYRNVLSVQLISPSGEKRFLPGGRTKLAVFKLGSSGQIVLCEGYATGLSVRAALNRLGAFQVWVCFSANNLEAVAKHVPNTSLVAADNDKSGTGEITAQKTGLRWSMPPVVGEDFNDLMIRDGLHAVVDQFRDLLLRPAAAA